MAEVHNFPDDATHAPLRKAQLERISKFMDAVIKSCLVWPAIATYPNYEAGEIAITDLTSEDRQTLFQWALPDDLDAVSTFVHNRAALWELYRMGEKFHTRPSAIVGITDAWLAFDFDKAACTLGIHIENEINAPTDKDSKQAQARATAKLKSILGVRNPQLITTREQAIAAGFIPS